MPLTLTRRTGRGEPLAVDLRGVVPGRLRGLDGLSIARLRVVADGRQTVLGELFDVAGDASDAILELRGDCSCVHRIAAGMDAGTIRVAGDAGRHAAEGMVGGRLEVAGDAGDWLAAELRGGDVLVAGRAGDNVAGALPGSTTGMRGGIVVVAGDAGDLVGARMRRGIVGIGGACGQAAAFEMRAGTLVIAGAVGRRAGLGMRRGSVIAISARPEILPTFRHGAVWTPAYLPLIFRRLAAAGFRPAGQAPSGPWVQWHGDGLAGGRGELLHPA